MKFKLAVLIAILFFSFKINAQEINWLTLEEAVALQKKEPRKIMIDMYTVWCGPCKLLDKNTFHNKAVVDYVNTNYYAVKFNAEGNAAINFKGNAFKNPNYNPANSRTRNASHQLSRYFGINAYPTLVYLDENSDLIAPISGYKTPKQLEIYLKLFETDAYKTITNQEEFKAYVDAFKYEFN